MHKIVTITEFNKPFVYQSTGYAIQELSTMLDCELDQRDLSDWKKRDICPDNGQVIFIVECSYMEQAGLTTKEIRQYYPNCKIVALGSDTIYFVTTGKWGGFQFQTPKECDLFLETMSICENVYREKNIIVDHWNWSISNKLIQQLKQYKLISFDDRKWDLIGLYSPHTINSGYRKEMIDYIRKRGYKFTRTEAKGMDDINTDYVYETYCNSKFCLETTSHNNPNFHGMKGYRWAIAPFTNTLLICDDYQDVLKYWYGGTIIPIYGYGKFAEIPSIIEYFSRNKTHRIELLKQQRKWIQNITIERQLYRKLKQYEII